VFQSNVQNLQWITTGERLLGPITDYDAAAAIERGEPLGLSYPKEGVVAVPGVTAIVKTGKHPNAARLFAEWLLSDEGQASYLANKQYGARTDVPAPKGLKTLGELKLLPVNFDRIEKEGRGIRDRYMKGVTSN
jgi:iron(III) transport system substrate-binding protein